MGDKVYAATGKNGNGENVKCRIVQSEDDCIVIYIVRDCDNHLLCLVGLRSCTSDGEEGAIDDLVDVLVGAKHSACISGVSIDETGDYVVFDSDEDPENQFWVNRYWMYNAICRALQ